MAKQTKSKAKPRKVGIVPVPVEPKKPKKPKKPPGPKAKPAIYRGKPIRGPGKSVA